MKSAEKVSTIAPEIIKVASPKPENKTEPSPLPAVEIKVWKVARMSLQSRMGLNSSMVVHAQFRRVF